MSAALRKSFLLSLLLSGSMMAAEHAVCRSIGMLDLAGDWLEALYLATAAISTQEPQVDSPDLLVWLPDELQCVLRLPQTLRHCFVLRILARWPPEKCAAVLRIPAEIIDGEACAAARSLALFTEKEQIL